MVHLSKGQRFFRVKSRVDVTMLEKDKISSKSHKNPEQHPHCPTVKYYINNYLHHGFTNNRQHSLLGPMSWQPLFLLSTVVSQWWMAPRVAQSSVSWGPMLRSWRRTAKASLFSWQPSKKASASRHRLVLAGAGGGGVKEAGLLDWRATSRDTAAIARFLTIKGNIL